VLSPAEARERLTEIATLRIKVFREFPYIYDGSIDYEVKYLRRYFEAPNARFVAAFSKNTELIGVATCLPLQEEDDFVKKPFTQAGFDLSEIFYFGESVLLSEYRGQGLGHRFFDHRESLAREFSTTKYTVFCAVQRAEDHPLRPHNYRPHDEFWAKRGYRKNPELKSRFEWKDLDQAQETTKEMVYWMRKI